MFKLKKKKSKMYFFKLPKGNSLAWNVIKVICQETSLKFVCAEHFLFKDIVTTYSNILQDVAKVNINLLYS